MTYKIFDLFGNETREIPYRRKERKNLFTDYESFTEKFELKKTTDDCHTPSSVFKIILEYVTHNCKIQDDIFGLQVIRPFYPGGDYESIEYPENSIVIDNPPFSIISQICKHYESNGIKYFLFAPHLTLFNIKHAKTKVVVAADVVYENGANVKTSFISNIMGEYEVVSSASLRRDINALNKATVPPPKYIYPENVLTVTQIDKLTRYGIDISIKKQDCFHISELDHQKSKRKAIFGSGYLISEKAAAEKAAAEKAAAEKAAAEKWGAIEWNLSERELQIIASLNQ